jgi:hypothetical protein
MNRDFVQIAEFNFPFPAENFKTELINAGIEFHEHQIIETESTISIFNVSKVDFKKAITIKEKIDVENSISEVKHINKIEKKIAYFAIAAISIYAIYRVYSFLKFQLL